MMLVATSTSASPRTKASITSSSSCSGICPWAVTIRSSGTSARSASAASSIVSTRLCR